jgi:GDPmannose 4,6-dehydratase
MVKASKVALIIGATGQDGTYLTRFLLSKGYRIVATSRSQVLHLPDNYKKIGVDCTSDITFIKIDPENYSDVESAFTVFKPDEVYNLSAQSSVADSFLYPFDTIKSITNSVINILEVIKKISPKSRFYNAGSSETFGALGSTVANESTVFSPASPYGVSKLAAYWLVKNYRDAYRIFAVTGITFNHESCLRKEIYVTQKIVSAAKRIASGSKESLYLGNLDVSRDWGWAPEYVEAMWLMLQHDDPEDFVIGTGQSFQLKDFLLTVFSSIDLNWEDWVVIQAELARPQEVSRSSCDPQRIFDRLGWKASYNALDVARFMLEDKY